MPSENSHTAIGSARSADAADTCPHTSNRVAVTEAMSRAAPTNPSTGSARGTRRDRYSSEPSSRAVTAGMAQCRDRDEGEQVQRACGECGSAKRVHSGLLSRRSVTDDGAGRAAPPPGELVYDVHCSCQRRCTAYTSQVRPITDGSNGGGHHG